MRQLEQAALWAGAAAFFYYASKEMKKRRLASATAAEPLPLDIRSGATRPLKAGDETRWCFLSCGRVAHDFANALKAVEGAVLHTVATRDPKDLARAEAFAAAHGVRKAVGTYAEAIADPDVDIVYLSAMHSDRLAHVTQILEAGKHALVEKPLACSAADAKQLMDLARSKKLFLMEGMWTRFFPAVEKARELIDSGAIGAVTGVISDFGFDAADSGSYPTDFRDTRSGDPIYHQSIGGGALLWAGPYPLAAGILPFGAREPISFAAAGTLDKNKTEVDLSCSMTLTYADPGGVAKERSSKGCPPRGATVSLYTAIDAESAETTTYIGTHGRITIKSPAHCPTKIQLSIKGSGRAAGSVTDFEFPLPPVPAKAAPVRNSTSSFFYYPNSMGFSYEARAVQRCLRAGLIEPPQYTNDECLRTLLLSDEAKKQMRAAH